MILRKKRYNGYAPLKNTKNKKNRRRRHYFFQKSFWKHIFKNQTPRLTNYIQNENILHFWASYYDTEKTPHRIGTITVMARHISLLFEISIKPTKYMLICQNTICSMHWFSNPTLRLLYCKICYKSNLILDNYHGLIISL